MMKILKPSTQPTTISIRVPAELAQRLAAAKAAAARRGLALDVDQPLAKALARLVRQAEAELHEGECLQAAREAQGVAMAAPPQVREANHAG